MAGGVDVDDIDPPRPVNREVAGRTVYSERSVKRKGLPVEAGDGENLTSGDVGWVRTVEDAATMSPEHDKRVAVYGRVVETLGLDGYDPDEIGSTPIGQVDIADRTGMTAVKLDARLDLPELEPGQEVLVTDLEPTGEDNPALTFTSDTRVAVTAVGTLEDELYERSPLVNTTEWYDRMDVADARSYVAEKILDEYHIETPRGQGTGLSELTMYLYIDNPDSDYYGTWTDVGREVLNELLQKYLPTFERTDAAKNKIVAQIRDETRVPADAWAGGVPDDEELRWTIAVENGVVDLRTGELGEYAPRYRHESKLPVAYDPDASLGDAIDEFLTDVTPDGDDAVVNRELMLKMVAHSLPRCYPTKTIWYMLGPGDNGKSVWLEVLMELLGSDNYGTAKIEEVAEGDNIARPIKGHHAVIDDDATGTKISNINGLKRLSGQSSIQIDGRWIVKQDYKSFASVIAAANNPMIIGDKSNAVKSRIEPIVLPWEFTSNPEKLQKDHCKPEEDEETLKARLMAEEELQGLLAAAVERAAELYRDGRVNVRNDEESWKIYEKWSDTVLRFWTECMTQDQGVRVSKKAVYATYVQWCHHQGVEPLSNRGRNNFWSLSEESRACSFKDDVWIDSDTRAVEHVTFDADAMEYAPAWVQDEWADEIDGGETSTIVNRLDRDTSIPDLKPGYNTVEADVVLREEIGDQYSDVPGIKVVLDDTNGRIDAVEWLDGAGDDAKLDGVHAGDSVRLTSVQARTGKGNVPELRIKAATKVEKVEDDDGGTVNSRGEDSREAAADGGDGGEGRASQDEVVNRLKSEIAQDEMTDAGSGAEVDRVLSRMESRHAIDRNRAEHALQKLKKQGDVYEVADGRVRAVNGGDA